MQSDPIKRLLTLSVMGKPLSFPLSSSSFKLTWTYVGWREDIPELIKEYWDDIIITYITNVISAKDRFIQLKFLHRAYYILQKLANIYPTLSRMCTRWNFQLVCSYIWCGHVLLSVCSGIRWLTL